MKTSLWLSVDPLALYNPIFEDEFYFDGDHNGGVYNGKNLSYYGYCYQNPIKYVDPNGKQVDVIKPKKTATERAYNPKTGNTDIGLIFIYKVEDFINKHNSYKREKTELSNKDITSSVKSKDGGDKNKKTTGKQFGDNTNIDGFLTGAPGAAKKGNNFKSLEDILEAGNDIKALFEKGLQVGDGVDQIIKENHYQPTNSKNHT